MTADRIKLHLRGLDRFVTRRMKDWDVPGCTVGVLSDDRVVHTGAYGLRNVARKQPVAESTLLYTASFGKTFTATLVAVLLDEGKLAWDRPIRDYIPSFRMFDQLATRRATLRDFLSHRTGLGSHGRMWVNSPMSRADVLRNLRHLQPKGDFRSAFGYCNLNYIIVGAVAEHVTGEMWEDLVRTRLLRPLGMTATRCVTDDLSAEHGLATGYEKTATANLPFLRSFRRSWSLAGINGPCAPAGALFSDITDMCRYVQLHMHHGIVGGDAIVGKRSLGETHTPQMLWPGLSSPPEMLDAFYAMGWIVQPYPGHRCVYSGGNGYGFGMKAAFFPDDKIGVVVMTNQARTPMANVIARNVFDRTLGLRQIPWNRRSLSAMERRKARHRPPGGNLRSVPQGCPARPLQSYVGQYSHPAYGSLYVTLRGNRLLLLHNEFPFRVRRRSGDVFTISLPTDHEKQASFAADDGDRVVSVAIPFAPGIAPIVFSRVPSAQKRSTTRT